MRCCVGLMPLLALAVLLARASQTESASSFNRPSVDSSYAVSDAATVEPGMSPFCNGVQEGRSKSPLVADVDGDAVQDDDDNCITVYNPGQEDDDGDEVGDACDECPNTAPGDPVDGDGCSTVDDDGDGVLNDEDDCLDTPSCADVGSDGCPLDGDDDGVPDGCDDCPDTPAGTAVDASGCAVGGQETQGCCGTTGPVAPLGLAAGLLLLGRSAGWRKLRRG